jgi:DNA replication ATP-dependent helicase Dna2
LSFELKHQTPHLDDLNDEQRKALVRAFCCKDFQMVIGVPGSGKQVTMVRFLTIAKQLGLKVVLFGVNQTSLDSILMKLLEY